MIRVFAACRRFCGMPLPLNPAEQMVEEVMDAVNEGDDLLQKTDEVRIIRCIIFLY